MVDQDSVRERGRGAVHEDDYFRKRDQELVEKLRRETAAAQARAAMGQQVGLTDPELLKELETLGFTQETVVLLPLLPAVQVAWADGGVSPAERELIVQLARRRGVDAGSAADRTLNAWLVARPRDDVFATATRLIRAILASPEAPGAPDLTADELLTHYESIAAASGGLLGRNRISAEERRLLTALTAELKAA
jgi:tellurite resistance protein